MNDPKAFFIQNSVELQDHELDDLCSVLKQMLTWTKEDRIEVAEIKNTNYYKNYYQHICSSDIK
jgi:hypothetical protein